MPHPIPDLDENGQPKAEGEGPESVSIDPVDSANARGSTGTTQTKGSRASYLVTPDGDAQYYQSTAYIMEQLNARRSEKTPEGDQSKEEIDAANRKTTAAMESGVLSDEDAWLLASMEHAIRNPFCIANHKAQQQVAFYEKVFGTSFIFMTMVAVGTLVYIAVWNSLLESGAQPFMPCRSLMDEEKTFGTLRLCNETSSKADDGCDTEAALSICPADACIDDPETGIRTCWYVAAGVMVVLVAYLLLLFRRDQAGLWLLSCACFIEIIWAGALTLSFETSFFLELFTYLAGTFLFTLVLFRTRVGKQMEWWASLPSQVGSTSAQTPDVEIVVFKMLRQCFGITAAIVCLIALIWHFAIPSLLGGTHAGLFSALIFLWLSVGWILREISWTSHKFDPEHFIPMCLSFHVDVYAVSLIFVVYFFLSLTDITNPARCFKQCSTCCERCASFVRGSPLKDVSKTDVAEGNIAKADDSPVITKEVEEPAALQRKKMLNAASGCGIVALVAVIFIHPVLSFVVSLLICVGLPFVRAKASKIEETENATV